MGRLLPGKKVWRELRAVSASDRWSLVEIPIISQLYILPAGARFDKEDSFAAAPVIEYIGTDEVYIRGLRMYGAQFDREVFRRMRDWLRSRGIKRIRYRHRGRERVV